MADMKPMSAKRTGLAPKSPSGLAPTRLTPVGLRVAGAAKARQDTTHIVDIE